MNRRRVTPLVLVLLLLVIGVGSIWLWPRLFPSADSMQDAMPGMPGMPMPESRPEPRSDDMGSSPKPQSTAVSPEPPGVVAIPPEHLQTIGVKYEPVARRPLEKTIRTVGRVAVDERRLAKVTIKFHGWIEELFVSAIGDHARKRQRLFTIYPATPAVAPR